MCGNRQTLARSPLVTLSSHLEGSIEAQALYPPLRSAAIIPRKRRRELLVDQRLFEKLDKSLQIRHSHLIQLLV